MTLHQLITFATVANHHNVSRASAELHVSQASISHQLKGLEEEYKVKLYKRIRKGIELTAKGQTFLKHVKVILNDLQKLNEEFHVTLPTKEARLLTIGGTFAPSASLLPQLLAVFKRSHPHVRLSLRTDNWSVIERLVLNSDVEVAVINHPPRSPRLFSEPYHREKLVAFAPVNHPLTKKRNLTLRDLLCTPLVLRLATRSSGWAEQVLRQIEPKIEPNIVLRCDSPEAVKMAVRKNMGIGIIFQSVIESDIRSGDFSIVKLRGEKLEGQSYIIYQRDRPLSAHAREFLTLLRQRRRTN